MATALGPSGQTVVAWIFTALLLFLAVVSTMAARNHLGPNPFIGIRTPGLKRSNAAWRAGHAAAAPVSWIGFVAALTCALLAVAVPAFRFGVVIVFLITVIVAFTAATRAGRRAS